MTLNAPETNWTSAPLFDYRNEIQAKNDDLLTSGFSELLSALNELKSDVKDLKLEIKELKEETRRSDVRELKESMHKTKMEQLEKEMQALKTQIEQLQVKKEEKEKLTNNELVFNFDLDNATSFFEPLLKTSNRSSKSFQVGGLPWCLYCDLKEVKRQKYLGLYLRSENIGETPGTWAANAIYELRLLSPSGNVIKNVRFCNRFERCTSFGQHQFVSYDELKKGGLIEKDRVKLQIYLIVNNRR